MTRLSKRELSEIIRRDKPGYEIVDHEPSAEADAEPGAPAAETDHVTDLDDLRRRYLGDSAAGSAASDNVAVDVSDQAEEGSSEDEDEIVVLRPPNAGADPWAPGPGRKSVIVSGKERRVIAEQG